MAVGGYSPGVRKALVAVILALIVPFTASPAHAATGKTVSDRPPVALSTGKQVKPGGLSTQSGLDAANAYVLRQFPASSGYQGSTYCGGGCANPNPWKSLASRTRVNFVNDATGHFYSTSFYIKGGTDFGGYIGLQTHLHQPDGSDVGHGAIASIWGATGATPAPGATVVNDVESGVGFWSLHLPMAWVTGHIYEYSVNRVMSGSTFTGATTLAITDKTTFQTFNLGTITTPTSWGGFFPTSNHWDEEYLPSSYAACSAIAYSGSDVLGASTWVAASYPPSAFYSVSDAPSIQQGTGCTNTAVINLGSRNFREEVGTG